MEVPMADFPTDMTQKLKAGGEEGIKVFIGMARIMRANAGNAGIAEWVQVGFPALPPKDQQIVLAVLLDSYLEHETGGQAVVSHCQGARRRIPELTLAGALSLPTPAGRGEASAAHAPTSSQ